jgi:plasmid stabilization system protein ParE
MTLRFSARARAHLNAIQEYISERNPSAALRVGERIRESAEMLRFFPYAGRTGRSANTREWVVRGYPYILVYEVDASEPPNITILGVFHQGQDPSRR